MDVTFISRHSSSMIHDHPLTIEKQETDSSLYHIPIVSREMFILIFLDKYEQSSFS